jgi:hypothetical protein
MIPGRPLNFLLDYEGLDLSSARQTHHYDVQ